MPVVPWVFVSRQVALGSLAALLVGCSILAPGDEEFLGGRNASAGAAGAGLGGGTGGGSAGVSGQAGSGGVGASAGAGGSSGAGAAGGGSGGTGGASGAPSGGSGGTGDASGAAGGGGAGGAPTCVNGNSSAIPRGIALNLFVDRTISMFSQNKFNNVQQAWSQFASNNNAVMDVALSVAPAASGSANCSGAAYQPPEINFAPLPGQASVITNALQAVGPGAGAAHMEAILNGGTGALKNYTPSGDKQPVLLIITDWTSGTDSCNTSSTFLGSVAAAALAAPPHVMTWMIDMGGGSSGGILNSIAKDGGSDEAIANGSSTSDVRSGLEQATRPCRFAAPANSTGGALSLRRSSPASQTFSQVSSIAQCGNNSSRWYSLGKSLVLCPLTCVQQPPSALYEITVTCT